jgi:mRNA interferase RelE/StbE
MKGSRNPGRGLGKPCQSNKGVRTAQVINDHWQLIIAAPLGRQLGRLPEAGAATVIELMNGVLSTNALRATRPLGNELQGKQVARRGEYRVIARIDEKNRTVSVLAVLHRRDAYR